MEMVHVAICRRRPSRQARAALQHGLGRTSIEAKERRRGKIRGGGGSGCLFGGAFAPVAVERG